MNAHFAKWRKRTAATLKALKPRCHPKRIIVDLSEDLLVHYSGKPLIDKYDVFQHLMNYWADTMQDDCYMISADGWKAVTYRVIEVKKDKDGKPLKEVDKGWECDLVPKSLIVSRYFAKQQNAVMKIEVELESTAAQMTELEDEHGGEEGAFSDDKVNKASVAIRLKEIQDDGDAQGDVEVLKSWWKLSDWESDLKRTLKNAQADLDAKALAKFPTLSQEEVQALVVDDKWLPVLDAAIHGEMDHISQALTRRVRELADRYETRMPEQVRAVAELEQAVNCHLKKMGFCWD